MSAPRDAEQIIATELELALGLPWHEVEPVAKRIAARLASTSPAPDGFGAFVRFGWVCEGDLIFDQAEADEARDSGGDVTTLYTAAPQPVVEKDNG